MKEIEAELISVEGNDITFKIKVPIYIDLMFYGEKTLDKRSIRSEYSDISDKTIGIFDKISNAELDTYASGTKKGLLDSYYESCETSVMNYNHSLRALEKAEKDGIITQDELKLAKEEIQGQIPLSKFIEREIKITWRELGDFNRREDLTTEAKKLVLKMIKLAQSKKT